MTITIPEGKPLTTGLVAKICRVAPRTVTKWADHGLLKCWKIPLSGDRRFDPAEVRSFMERHGFPVSGMGGMFSSEA